MVYTGGDKDIYYLQKDKYLLPMNEDNNPFKEYLKQSPNAKTVSPKSK